MKIFLRRFEDFSNDKNSLDGRWFCGVKINDDNKTRTITESSCFFVILWDRRRIC